MDRPNGREGFLATPNRTRMTLLKRHPLLLSVLTGMVALVFVLIHYGTRESFTHLGNLRGIPALLVVATLGLRWSAPTIKFKILTSPWERPLSWGAAFRLQLVGACGAAVTPAASGAMPTYLWFLWCQRAPMAPSLALMFYVTALDAVYFSVTVPALLPLYLPIVGVDSTSGVVIGALALSLGSLFVGVTLIWRPRWVARVVSVLFAAFPRIRGHLLRTVLGSVESMAEIRSRSLAVHLTCFLLTALEWLGVFLVLPLVALALDARNLDVLGLLIVQQVTQVVAFIFPTPGGSGWFEGVVPLAAGGSWPDEIAAPLIFLWRFFTYWIYLGLTVLLGPSVIARAIQRPTRIEDVPSDVA